MFFLGKNCFYVLAKVTMIFCHSKPLDSMLLLSFFSVRKLLLHQVNNLDRFSDIRMQRNEKSRDCQSTHHDQQEREDRLIVCEDDRKDDSHSDDKEVRSQTIYSVYALRILSQGCFVA